MYRNPVRQKKKRCCVPETMNNKETETAVYDAEYKKRYALQNLM